MMCIDRSLAWLYMVAYLSFETACVEMVSWMKGPNVLRCPSGLLQQVRRGDSDKELPAIWEEENTISSGKISRWLISPSFCSRIVVVDHKN